MKPIFAAAALVIAPLAVFTGGGALAQDHPQVERDGDFVPAPIPPKNPVVDPATLDDPQLQQGWRTYDVWCAVCHGQGRGMTGTEALRIKYDGQVPAVLEERTDLTPEFVKTIVRTGILSMAPFRKTEITDDELDDLAAYLARPR